MQNFIFAYHGGKMPESKEEGEKALAAWMAWFAGMGDAVVNMGNPVGKSSTVSSSGVTNDGGANPLSGYSIVKAANIGAAIALAKGSPQLDGGTIEIAEIIEME
jgi:hypothetical protein